YLTSCALLLPVIIASPYPYPNGTAFNGVTPTGTSGCSAPTAATVIGPPPRPSGPLCLDTFYPSELRIVDSRYATFNETELHARTNMFMALRQREDTFQVATQVQFIDVVAPNWTACHLKLDLPAENLQMQTGPKPILYVYQVEREAGSMANWEMYEPAYTGADQLILYGAINGTNGQQSTTREFYKGYYDIGSGPCNQTMTFQIGFGFDGGDEVNYWQFINTRPPLIPAQGFKI
ncbi:hypothetical protein CC80DRAFT_384079, partial [Byssothecium circinans]